MCVSLLYQYGAHALPESCNAYFEGFSLPDTYNPHFPPQTEDLIIRDVIFVKEITKVSLHIVSCR